MRACACLSPQDTGLRALGATANLQYQDFQRAQYNMSGMQHAGTDGAGPSGMQDAAQQPQPATDMSLQPDPTVNADGVEPGMADLLAFEAAGMEDLDVDTDVMLLNGLDGLGTMGLDGMGGGDPV